MNEDIKNNPYYTITIGDITYQLNPIDVRMDFRKYLDKLDPEMFNRCNEEFGRDYNLKDFSNLIEIDKLNESQILRVNKYIELYKNIVHKNAINKIIELSKLLND